ncbi:hypothetical protein PsorP6_018219 [Peronosclerospora sorghi]|uniref:Uncharacterized protein n=1 Tax=Peronosclerospora sorghi TaxID=230839 RepID=A0ACC0WC26_9STRA|nr:hypothetical protein PsorP6_018219 [Peronosclerospora sorghi]
MMRKSVKNRAPAPIQITAEQILLEANQRKEGTFKPPRRRITDAAELAEYRLGKRKAFEDELRRQRHHIGTWMKYAAWEESQEEFERARSVFERALDVDYKATTIWLKYAEMEMRHKFVNHARNVWDRAVTLLPRVAQFWYKYAFMEEMLGNLNGARRVFERWMEWQPDEQAWYSYIKLEMRAKNIPRARALFQFRFASTSPPRHVFADSSVGIGSLPLAPEETQAERELLNSLPEFREAAQVLLGKADEARLLPNSKRAEKVLLKLQRTVEICRSAMGFQSVYLQAVLRHLVATLFMKGDVKEAKKMMQERGDIMQWPVTEHERMLRLLLRSNLPKEAQAWCKREEYTKLSPLDEIVPLKWTLYDLIRKELSGGPDQLEKALDDPLFAHAVEILRQKKNVVLTHEETGNLKASEVQLGRDIPYLLAQYASLSVVSTRALERDAKAETPLTDTQQMSLNQAEVLYKEALAWVEDTAAEDDKDALLASGPNAPFRAWVETNLGELLLCKEPEKAMEWLGKAMSTLQAERNGVGGSTLAMTRVLGQVARGCHAMGQAVTSEGLFVTAVEAFEREATLSSTDRVEFARVLRAYGDLLASWEKRETDAARRYEQAEQVEQELARMCEDTQSATALHPIFYLPL